MRKLEAKFKLWLADSRSHGGFGEGKWKLLNAIENCGSLTAACKSLGISYRKAWEDLKKAEEIVGIPMVERSRGGKTGGTTRLTPQGKQWLKAYDKFHSDVERTIKRACETNFRKVSRCRQSCG